MMGQFSWDDLQYFLAVARTGQLSAAARRLRTNHVTVSRRIDRLEKSLSSRLFARSARGYTLTMTGERLVRHAETMEREADGFAEAALGAANALKGAVRLSAPEGFGNFFLAPRLPAFASSHPALTIEFVTIQQILSLSRREADVSVSLNRPPSGPYRAAEIVPYRLFVYAARDYLVTHGAVENREDVAAHPLIGYVEDMIFTPGLDYLREILPGMRASYQSSSIQAQLAATRAGYGIGILPYFLARDFPDLEPILPRELSLERRYWTICHEDLADAPRVRAVTNFVTTEARRLVSVFRGDALLS